MYSNHAIALFNVNVSHLRYNMISSVYVRQFQETLLFLPEIASQPRWITL